MPINKAIEELRRQGDWPSLATMSADEASSDYRVIVAHQTLPCGGLDLKALDRYLGRQKDLPSRG